jgi:MFS superfamily sulfate permease-like transporter
VDRELVLIGVDTLAGHVEICNAIKRVPAVVFHALITIIIITIVVVVVAGASPPLKHPSWSIFSTFPKEMQEDGLSASNQRLFV